MTTPPDAFYAHLASLLPHHRFHFYHISTPPLPSPPLFSPPPSQRPDTSYCEKHLLGVTIDAPRPVLILGIEAHLYTTAHESILFVSKADSTGFLPRCSSASSTTTTTSTTTSTATSTATSTSSSSPAREITSAWLRHLVHTRRRHRTPFSISLFARAQGQYLFPGSIDHGGKHVLDDRQLVRWWCRVLDPLVTTADAAFLVVPGLDEHETRAFLPRAAPPLRWTLGHPLHRLSHYARDFDWVPPRCLIPHFPDDPKARFVDELDDEALRSGAMKTTGSWKSVRDLDVFWDMMAFRQECSSGRLTGFIWVVYDLPDAAARPATPITAPATAPQSTTPRKLRPDTSPPPRKPPRRKKKLLTGPIVPRQPRIKTKQRNRLLDRPVTTKYYHWPPAGRGERIVDESDYRRILDLLLHLDFATLDKAVGSTARWLGEAGLGEPWGVTVMGERDVVAAPAEQTPLVNNLSGLIKRKRGNTDETKSDQAATVNVLGSGLVRKKPKA